MVYQLAKTSPLITGQVKCVLNMNGNKVSDMQFVPISDSIPFAYNNPPDTLNYTYMENIKMLYDKISDKFWSAEGRKDLSTSTLFYSKQLYHDTHDNTYERGMKRLPYSRYKKQYEFFCPVWCDNIDDFSRLKFKLNIEHAHKTRKIISTFLDTTLMKDYFLKHMQEIGMVNTDDKATKEIENIRYKFIRQADAYHAEYARIDGKPVDFTNTSSIYIMPDNTVWRETSNGNKYGNTYAITEYIARDINIHANENTEFIYFDFNNYRAWVKGINAETGLLQVCDDSYTLQNITSRERPLLEFDNMVANMFSRNKLVCTQLFNFDFIFNIEDILPLEFINSMIGEKINVYIDVYKDNKKVEYKDLYSNYEFIPRYDTSTGENGIINALDYMHDNKSIELIDKNKLVQPTFHWAFQNNNELEFNLYNGLSPVFTEIINGTSVTSTRRTGFMGDFPNIYAKEFVKYDNPLCIMKYTKVNISSSSRVVETILNAYNDDDYFYSFDYANEDEYQWFGNIRIDNYKFKKTGDGCAAVGIKQLDPTIKFGILDIGTKYNGMYELIYKTLKQSFSNVNICAGPNGKDSYKNIIVIYNSYRLMFVIFGYDSNIVQQLFFNNVVYNKEFISKFVTLKFNNVNDDGDLGLAISWSSTSTNNLTALINILKCTDEPTLIKTDGTVISTEAKHPDDYTVSEVSLVKNTSNINMFRYDMNIYPMFISTDNKSSEKENKNKVYWQKQYIGNILNTNNDIDNIADFNTKSFTKFSPIYPSIDYFVLKNDDINDYAIFYMDNNGYDYRGEKEWYDKNALFVLPTTVSCEFVSDKITESNISALLYNNVFKNIDDGTEDGIRKKIFDEFVFPLYEYKYTYDYLSLTDISKYKYTITYTLK